MKDNETPMCANCLFFRSTDNRFTGTCKRFPPTTAAVPEKGFVNNRGQPAVSGNDWCGEWKEAK